MRRVAEALLLGILCALALEGATRALYGWRGELPPQPDTSLRREWRWAQRHLEAGRAELPSHHIFHPRLGWALRPNLRDPLMHTNSLGLRADREFSVERVAGVARIALVGDSYTMGANMSDRDAFHAVLGREDLPGWEVLNLGVSGYGLDQAVLRFEELGARYRPDIAVLGFYLRDHFRNLDSFRAYVKPYFTLDAEGGLVLHREHLLPPEVLYTAYRSGRRRIGGWGYSWAWAALRQHLAPFLLPRAVAPDDPAWRISAVLLRRFRDAATARGGAPLLLTIPTRPESWAGTVYPELDRLALAEARALGLPAVSMAEIFYRDGHPERFFGSPKAGHLSVLGNREMARQVAAAVRRGL